MVTIGIPGENKPQEARWALSPAAVAELVVKGNKVFVSDAIKDQTGQEFLLSEYSGAGAKITNTVDVYKQSELIVRVKEPYGDHLHYIQPHNTIFSYLHWAAIPDYNQKKISKSGATCIAFESVRDKRDGSLPLLRPMSEIAGKLSVQVACNHLFSWKGGSGKLLGGITGVDKGEVIILGAGHAGYNAAAVASGLGASVKVFDLDMNKLANVEKLGANVTGLFSSQNAILHALKKADVVIGAVLIPDQKAPWLVYESMLHKMQKRSVIVDISIDQGGCVQTSVPTTHADPVRVVHGIQHYGVANMPGAVPVTASEALSNAIFPYVMDLANNWETKKLPTWAMDACFVENGCIKENK